ncbi:MAG: DUF1801 domain-containing protein [Cyclobacteriaceae bacterium]|nr:DUF1801 domain-containing protein [Cyclobacteriaceae bacterium HetDA_MAG_MS6]
MAKLKTTPNSEDVQRFLDSVDDKSKRDDCYFLLEKMKALTGKEPRMWGNSIVGFGSYHYVYDSGREGDWFLTGFSPRKQNLSIYVMAGFERYDDLMSKLGKYKTGKSCLYVKHLSEVDDKILDELIVASIAHMKNKYPAE